MKAKDRASEVVSLPAEIAARGWRATCTYPQGRPLYEATRGEEAHSGASPLRLEMKLREAEQLPIFEVLGSAAVFQSLPLIAAFMECAVCNVTAPVKARLSYLPGQGGYGSLAAYPIEILEGWWVKLDVQGNPQLRGMCPTHRPEK